MIYVKYLYNSNDFLIYLFYVFLAIYNIKDQCSESEDSSRQLKSQQALF